MTAPEGPHALTIERLGHRGDGIGRDAAGRALYAPRTLPGEVVEGARAGDRIARPRILTPSPERVRPPCPHYAACGGCALQHASEGFVAGWKEAVVAQALAAQGLSAPFRPMHVSPPFARRRATFALKRTKGGVLVGFHAPGSSTITDTPECRLVDPALSAARPALAALAGAGGSRKGALAATVTKLDAGIDVAVTGGKLLDKGLREALGRLCGDHGIVRLTWDGEPVAQAERPRLSIVGIAVTPPPGAFLQATEAGEAALRAAVDAALGPARQVVDLFAGCGTFALPLTRRAEVHAVEGDAAMVAALQEGWRAAGGLHRLTAEARDLFRRPLEPDELAGFDGAVIDPPRAGAEAQTARLAASGVPRIAAVSCNPATFARDARVLCEAGYRLDWVQVVDQFRWSTHVELAAQLTRPHTAPQSGARPSAPAPSPAGAP
jgi:23S rRNA (uracil1939-C5)-methyltransferase